MSKVIVTESSLEAIATAIRTKTGGSTTYKPSEMATAIGNIPTGITPTGTVSITQNGTVDVTQYASASVAVPNSYAAGDEGKVVSNGALVAQTARSSEITANGTYDTTLNNQVVVNVPSGGGGTINWKDTFSVNWDFSNPVNTRGSSSYGSSSLIYTLDGWQMQGGKLSFVTGGIKLERYASGTVGYYMQRYKSAAMTGMKGKTFTLSTIIDGVLNSITDTILSSSGSSHRMTVSGVVVRVYSYSGSECAVTIDIAEDTGSHVIQAIKLESGSTQTLATQVNGVWTLNNNMDSDTEYIKARIGVVYNQ